MKTNQQQRATLALKDAYIESLRAEIRDLRVALDISSANRSTSEREREIVHAELRLEIQLLRQQLAEQASALSDLREREDVATRKDRT